MHVTDNRLKEVVTTYVKNGLNKTLSKFPNINAETVNRYCREYRIRFGEEPINKEEEEIEKPNILIFDIETMPLDSWVWGQWKQNINNIQINTDWFMATWSAKWLGEKEIYSRRLSGNEMKEQNDKRILEDLWKFMEEADIVIAHNGKRFDVPRMQTRFLYHEIQPPLPYQQIDTLIVAKKQFAITSNKLDYIGRFLGVGSKLNTGGFELWRRCMKGDESALKDMETYNKRDVELLEMVYLKLRPYIKSHPNWGLFTDSTETICPTCGSRNIEWEGAYTTSVGKYSTLRCKDCGSIARSRHTELSIQKRKSLVAPIAR